MKDLPSSESSRVTDLIGLDRNGQSVRLPNDGAKIGSLSDLVTEDKSNLVNAINEAYAHGGGGGGGGGSTIVVNNLTSTSTTAALSANQGRLLNENKIEKGGLKTINGQSLEGSGNIEIQGGGGSSVNVVDNLESESADDALAARQGKVLKSQIDTKMPANQQFKTIGGQSIFGTGNIPTSSSGDLPTYQRHAIDMQPSCIMQTNRFDLPTPMKAGVTYHVGCMNTTLEGARYDAQAIGKITVAVKPIYIDGTTGSDPIIQLGWGTADWNNTAPFREIEFTPTKDVVAWNVMGGKPNESQANPKYWYWHWEETVEKPSVWDGKHWLFIGDSIYVDGVHMQNHLANISAPYMIGDELGMLVFNASIAGYKTCYFYDLIDALEPQLNPDFTGDQSYYNYKNRGTADDHTVFAGNIDVVSIALGSNNHIYGTSLGTSLYNATYNRWKDNRHGYLEAVANGNTTNANDFHAELQLLVDMIRDKYPAVPLMLHSTLKRIVLTNDDTAPDGKKPASSGNNSELDAINGNNQTLADFSAVINKVAINYGCPYVDLTHCCTPKTSMERLLWYTPNGDGVHVNENAHRYRIKPIIMNQFREIAPYYFNEF